MSALILAQDFREPLAVVHLLAFHRLEDDPFDREAVLARLVADAIDISRRTARKIHQNLFWAFVNNAVDIPLAALGLLDPMLAGAAMALSSVCVVANALRRRRWTPRARE